MTIAEKMKTREQRIQEERERDEYYSARVQAPPARPLPRTDYVKNWPPINGWVH